MSDRLTVESGETYQLPSGASEEYSGATVDGTLEVDGTLHLIDDPAVRPGDEAVGDGTGIDLPISSISFTDMNIGLSLFLAGFIGIMWGAIAWVRAYAAGVVLAFAMIALIMSGLLNIGLEVFWATIVLSLILLVAGVVVQWTR